MFTKILTTKAMENETCVFCDIVSGLQNAAVEYESDNIIIIKDIMPKAPVHLLVMPKRHIKSLNEMTEADSALMAELLLAAKAQAQKSGIAESGYKLVLNNGQEGGQIIPHLHFHLMGGKQLPA